jgi:glycosyltransferase involved in cell wall biosynthesis
VILNGEFKGVNAKGRIRRTILRILQLRKLCKQHSADVMVSFIEEANSRALLSTIGLKTKNLISVRVDPNELMKYRSARLQIKLLYPLADGCVYQTETARDSMPKNLRTKSRVIFNPVSDVFFRAEVTPGQEKRVVTCGRLANQKRFDLLIDAFCQVCDDFPDYRLEIYGTGWLEEELQQQIDDLNRADQIRLMGRSEDVPHTIGNAGLFVLSSDYEGLPNALMEAMALGLPIVSTDCSGGGAKALIDPGKDGLLVPCDDADALAEAIRQMLSDPAAAAAMGQQAKQKAAGFAADSIVAQWEDYLQKIAENI